MSEGDLARTVLGILKLEGRQRFRVFLRHDLYERFVSCLIYAPRDGRPESEQRLAREGLAAYAAWPLFRTVSLDRTFYAPLDAAGFARYAAAVPEDFRFVVKAPAAITDPFNHHLQTRAMRFCCALDQIILFIKQHACIRHRLTRYGLADIRFPIGGSAP